MTTQEIFADFIVGTSPADIDPQAMDRARTAIIDSTGVALAGSKAAPPAVMKRYLNSIGDLRANGEAFLLGGSDRASAATAALFNGVAAHSLDYDDDSHPGSIHLSASLLPALMSVSMDKELFKENFRAAYTIGYEVAGKIGRVFPRPKRRPSFHPTCTVGVIGCAAAVAKMLSFDRETTKHALGIAASSAAGLRANAGTMTKSFHAGRAAQGGVMAALLARDGYESSADAYDGMSGYFQAFGVVSPEEIRADVDEALGRIADPWEICTEMGFRLKSYPSCGGTHNGIEAAQLIRSRIDYQEIDSIYIGTSAALAGSLPYHLPDEGLQGKFSMEYCVAAALKWGAIRIDTFTDDKVRDPEIRHLIEVMTVQVDDRVRDDLHGAVVEVTLKSGEKLVEAVKLGKGKGDRWMTLDDQREKFDDTAGSVLGVERARKLFELLASDEALDQTDVASYLHGDL